MTRLAAGKTWHDLHILLLLLFRPAALFARINALPWYRDMLQHWARSVIGAQPGSILEAGCAGGELSRYLAQLGHTVCGLDHSTAMLGLARASPAPRVGLVRASVMALPFADGQFDRVLAASLLNVLEHPAGALKEMARVCKPGGKVAVLVPRAGFANASARLLAQELQLEGDACAALLAWHRMARKLPQAKLAEYFSAAGLSHPESGSYLNGMVTVVTATRA